MHTVIETQAYLNAAVRAGMTDVEMRTVVDTISADPLAGDVVVGSGGCRKVRIAGRGKGKSGGYRVITYYGGDDVPVFLLGCLSKGSTGNFTDAQVKAFKVLTAVLLRSLGR